jgi:hypothetical protein
MSGRGQVDQPFTISTNATGHVLSSPSHPTRAAESPCFACCGMQAANGRACCGSRIGVCGLRASTFHSIRCFASGWAIVAPSKKHPVMSLQLGKTTNRASPWRRWPCCSSGTSTSSVRGAGSSYRMTNTASSLQPSPSWQPKFRKVLRASPKPAAEPRTLGRQMTKTKPRICADFNGLTRSMRANGRSGPCRWTRSDHGVSTPLARLSGLFAERTRTSATRYP